MMAPPDGLLLGLDFGGTKLAAGLVDPRAGRVLDTSRRPTDAEGGAEQAITTMLAMARDLLEAGGAPVTGVGINFGGPVDASHGVVLTSNHVPGWDRLPLAARLSAALGLPARLENDANGQALAEYCFGAGRASSAMVYLNLGTGIGGGIVLKGRLLAGAHGLAGEFGHMTIRADGPRCACGRTGCLEALCSGTAMGRRAREWLATSSPTDRQASRLLQVAGSLEAVTGRDLTRVAADGDRQAQEILEGILQDLARGLANIASCLDPEVIVLGGGAAELGADQFQRLRALSEAACFAPLAGAYRLLPAALGADAGIFGGAALFLQP